MPATLSREDDKLVLNLAGHPSFRDALERVKRIPGRRYDADRKRWVFPANEHMAMRIMNTVQPDPDAAVRAWLREAAVRAADELAAALPDPDTVELYWPGCTGLFDFQRPMVEVMATAERYICGDDMGLGKTIESICAVEEWRERARAWLRDPRAVAKGHDPAMLRTLVDRPKLVIAGTSKIGDWVDELEAWLPPGTPVEAIPGDWSSAKRRRVMAGFERTAAAEGGWVIVNHEQIRAKPADAEARARDTEWTPIQPWFAEQDWLAKIADESHRFKNGLAQQTRGLWLIDAHLRYHLTGTPIINSPDEVWAMLADVRPDLYGERGGTADDKGIVTYWQFYFTYVESYAVEGRGRVVTGVKNPEELRFELSDKFGRRSKRLLVEKGLLPKKLPTRYRHVPMRPGQRKLYESTEASFWLDFEMDIEDLRQRADTLEDRESDMEATGEQAARNEDAASAKALLAQVEAAVERGEDIGRVTRFLPNAGAKYAILRQIATSPAVVDEGLADESGKLDALMEDIQDHEGKQFVVFTWHRRAAEIVAARLNKRRITAEWMHGGTDYLERTEVVRRFNDGETQILVTTIKTGGEGLNLVAADTVYFVEQADTVAANDQGEDRLWRIGQDHEVQPIVLRSEGTVETDNQAPRLRMKELIMGATIGRDRDPEENE